MEEVDEDVYIPHREISLARLPTTNDEDEDDSDEDDRPLAVLSGMDEGNWVRVCAAGKSLCV